MPEIIDNTTLLRCNADNLPDTIIGVAVQKGNKPGLHSGIFIKYNGKGEFFHFTGKGIFFSPAEVDNQLFFKELKDINIFIPAILAFLRKVKRNSKPKYAMYYTGSIYDLNGNLKDENSFPDYFTCVGFCLAVIKTILLGQDLINYLDWPQGSGVPLGYTHTWYEEKVKPYYPAVTLKEFGNGVRRITPLEYLTAGYADSRPASKIFTDTYKPQVKATLIDYTTDI